MNEGAPGPGSGLTALLDSTASGLEWAMWPALAILAALWVLGKLARFAPESPLARLTPEFTTNIGYLIVGLVAVTAVVNFAAFFVENTVWSWLPRYAGQLLNGLWVTISLLVLSLLIGFTLAVPVGLVQVTGPWPLAMLARAYCTFIRGTPILIQLWLLYYGLGSLFPYVPWIRDSFLWPVLREGYFYGLLALTLSVIGYEAEIMRGAFLSVPRGEIEAARAFGMSPFTLLRRIWFPRAVRIVLPALSGEVIEQLKATPIVATVTVFDLFGVSSKIRQETYNVYEPLLLVAVIYFALVYVITKLMLMVERQVPQKR